MTALPLLNDWLIERTGRDGFVPRWNGLRLVAVDASAVRFGLIASQSAICCCLTGATPARWLMAALNQRGIPFCMRVEKSGNSGFTCVRDFLRSGLSEQVVTLRAVERRDAIDFECPSEPQTVRLVRHIAPNGQVPFISRTETHCPR